MNASKIYSLLNDAYDIMNKDDNEYTRKAVLALLDLYNEAASKTPEVYQQLKNGTGSNDAVWIVAA